MGTFSGGAACNNFFYLLDNPTLPYGAAGLTTIYKNNLNGMGTPTVVATFSNQLCVDDLITDCNCNFYVLDNQTPQTLMMFDSNGNALCSYTITNPISRNTTQNGVSWNGGMASIGNTLYVRTGDSPYPSIINLSKLSGLGGGHGNFYAGLLGGSSITFTPIIGFPSLHDMASMPMCFSNSITVAANAGSISCATSTAAISVSVSTPLSPVSYNWVGPRCGGWHSHQCHSHSQCGWQLYLHGKCRGLFAKSTTHANHGYNQCF